MTTGIVSLGDFTITSAGTQTGDWTTTDLDGLLAATFDVRFAYGSGGTTVKVWVQTTLDDGATVIDIACVALATASEHQVFNLSGLTPKTTLVTPTDGALADDTCVDGVLGDQFRVKLTSAGTYAASTTVRVRMNAR